MLNNKMIADAGPTRTIKLVARRPVQIPCEIADGGEARPLSDVPPEDRGEVLVGPRHARSHTPPASTAALRTGRWLRRWLRGARDRGGRGSLRDPQRRRRGVRAICSVAPGA